MDDYNTYIDFETGSDLISVADPTLVMHFKKTSCGYLHDIEKEKFKNANIFLVCDHI